MTHPILFYGETASVGIKYAHHVGPLLGEPYVGLLKRAAKAYVVASTTRSVTWFRECFKAETFKAMLVEHQVNGVQDSRIGIYCLS